MWRHAVGLGIILWAAAGTSADAQVAGAGGVAPEDMAQGRPKRELRFEVRGEVEYDTNIARAGAVQAALQGVRPEDVVYSPRVAADVVIPVGQQALFLSGTAGYDFHDVNAQLDHSRIDMTGGLGGRLGPCGGVVSAGYARGRSQLNDRALSEVIDNILEVERVAAGLTCARPSGIGVIVEADRSWGSNSEARTALNNYEMTSATASLMVGRAAVGKLSLLASYSHTTYGNRPLINGSRDGFDLYLAGLQAERRLGGRIEVNAAVSYVISEMLETPPPVPGSTSVQTVKFEGITYSADVSYRASSRIRFQGAFERAVAPTLVQSQSYEIQTNYAVDVDYRMSSRFLLGLSLSQKESDTRGVIVTGRTSLVRARTRLISARLQYKQSRRLAFSLAAERARRATNDPLFDYTSNRVRLATIFTY
jgi:hypothetical protein